MSSLLEGVRQYDNSPAAIGYTVYYYAHDMEMAQGLKLLSIDGTAPARTPSAAGNILSSILTTLSWTRTRRRTARPHPLRLAAGRGGPVPGGQEGYVSILEQEG